MVPKTATFNGQLASHAPAAIRDVRVPQLKLVLAYKYEQKAEIGTTT
jgi:hypothetical protein